jgi:succinate dehydrogenase hydrophobic anchor subunit
MKESTIRLIQYFTALLIFILIGFHLGIFTQFLGPGYSAGLDYLSVLERMKNAFYDTIYLILLFSLLTHGFIGIRNIMFEIFLTSSIRRIITLALIIVYIFFLLYGALPIFYGVEECITCV